MLGMAELIFETLFDEGQEKACPLISHLVSVTPVLIDSAIAFASNPNFEKIVEDNETLQELVTNLLTLLALTTQDAHFYPAF